MGVTNVAEKRWFLTERKQLLADDDTSYSVINFIQTISMLHKQYQFFTISLSVLFMNLFIYCLPYFLDTAVFALNSLLKGIIILQFKSQIFLKIN